MKLAEALNLRADSQNYIRQLERRLLNNARIQEGCEPTEQAEYLLEELNRSVGILIDLVSRINKTNHAILCDNITLTEMLAKRYALSLGNSILTHFVYKASDTEDPYGGSVGITYSTIDVSAFYQKVNQNSLQIRELDNKIQRLNWQTDLLE